MRSAADSISSNIAEGNSRSTTKGYISFLYNAQGSNSEVQTQLQLCVVHRYLTEEDIKKAKNISISIHKKLDGLIASLKRKEEQRLLAEKARKLREKELRGRKKID